MISVCDVLLLFKGTKIVYHYIFSSFTVTVMLHNNCAVPKRLGLELFDSKVVGGQERAENHSFIYYKKQMMTELVSQNTFSNSEALKN